MKTTVLLEQEPHAQGHVVRALLRIEGEAPTQGNRTPLNLSIVLDRSGSMSGPKLRAAREAAALLVQQLAAEDFVSVVAYDDVVETVAEPSAGSDRQLSQAIRSIDSGSTTNLSGGWLRGRELVARNAAVKTANRVLLLTDGLANVGIRDPQQLAALCANALEHGIRTTTIGFGADYDEHLLGQMAEAGGGHMYYIEHADQAGAVFREELEGLLSLAAQNLSLFVKPADAASAVAVHHSYPRMQTADGLRLELGDLYAREPKLVLLEFLVPAGHADPVTVAQLTLTATVLGADGSVKQQEIELKITTSLAEGAVANAEVRRELLLLEAARARSEALADQQRGDFASAAARMQKVVLDLKASGLDDAVVREEAADLEYMAGQVGEQFTAREAKYMYQRAYDSTRGMRSKMDIISRTKREKRKPEA